MGAELPLGELRDALVALGDPERARQMASYMKDHFVFLGIGSVDRRAAARGFVIAASETGPDVVLDVAMALWQEPEREFQYTALDLLRRVGGRLPADSLGRIRHLVVSKSWWDTVDPLAKVVGQVVGTHPDSASTLDDWATDDDMWVARAAILHQLGWKERAQPEVVFRYCAGRIDHPDFFIRKAIGWALRDLARTFPDEVWGWVDTHPDLSGLSRREATKHR